MTHKKNIWLCCALLLLLPAILISPWDYTVTQWLGNHPLMGLTKFMDRSFFEGHKFGGGDLATLYMIGGALLYIAAWLPLPSNRLIRLRPELGFILTSCLVTTVFVVHGLKWTVGRARPFLVLWNGEQPFTSWFTPGPYNLLNGFFNGSFPSGHTATMMIFLTLAYIIAFHGRWNRYRLGSSIGWMTIGLAYLMAIARSMNRSHFITDGMVVIPISWLVIHLIYFNILKIPEQQETLALHGQIHEMPTCWEFRLCLRGLVLVLGLMAVAIGVRSWSAGAPLPAIALSLTGVVLTLLSAGTLWRFYSHIAETFVNFKASKAGALPPQGFSS